MLWFPYIFPVCHKITYYFLCIATYIFALSMFAYYLYSIHAIAVWLITHWLVFSLCSFPAFSSPFLFLFFLPFFLFYRLDREIKKSIHKTPWLKKISPTSSLLFFLLSFSCILCQPLCRDMNALQISKQTCQIQLWSSCFFFLSLSSFLLSQEEFYSSCTCYWLHLVFCICAFTSAKISFCFYGQGIQSGKV